MQLALRRRLLASTVLVGATLLGTAAQAQDTAQVATADADESAPAIVVTGSRIASPTLTAVSPVQVIGDVQIDQAGVNNIQELLLENPVFGTPALSRTNSAFLTSGTGVASIDLRDLGSARTLVLINGRRVVAGVPGSTTVDLNIIPQQFLSATEILTGGASSQYGSDAVAGVVNFIYRDNFEGVEANAQYNITERGDNRDYQINITTGTNFADDRGNIMVHFGYNNQGQLLSRQRPNTRVDDLDTFFNFTGDPADYGVPFEPFLSSFAPQGRFDVLGTGGVADDFTFGPNGQLQPCTNVNGAACSNARGTGIGPNGFNRQFFRTLAVPVERYLFAARAAYELRDNIRFIGEATYNNTSSSRIIEPFPLESGGRNGIFPVGRVPIEVRVPIEGAPGTFNIVRNPFVPDAIFNAASDRDGDGLRDIAFARRLSEFGTRNGQTNRDLYRFVAGFDGTLFNDKFRWDLTYNYGRTSESQQSNGQVNVLNFRNALTAIPGPDGAICADPQARAAGCVPVNIYGFDSVSPAAVNYIAADQTLQTRITQQVVQGNLSGSPIELPAGPLGIAVGFEYRKETSFENNDALTNAGLNAGNALPDTSGSFDVKEIYGELRVPILSETPGFHALSIVGAGRISDYSTVGTVYNYNVGAEWSPIEEIRFSGTYARAVRAPNIGELFQGPAQTFPTGLVDPCVGVTATSQGTRDEVCRAAPGVLANIAANNGVFALTQPDLQGISGFNSGNPNLEEETSDSYTASMVIAPRSIDVLRNLVIRVDYFNIRVKDSIVTPPRAFLLDQCYRQNNPEFCSFIIRRPEATGNNSAGSIEFINVGAVNGGSLATEGIDFTLTNRVELADIGVPGALNFRLAYTRVLEGFVVPLPGADRDVFAGEIGSARDRFTATVAYQGSKFSMNLTGIYIGRSSEDDQSLAQFDLAPGAVSVPAEFYLDMQASWRASREFEFYFGIDNLLDNDAPNILSGSPFNVTGSDTAADVYDVFGRRFYAGARMRF